MKILALTFLLIMTNAVGAGIVLVAFNMVGTLEDDAVTTLLAWVTISAVAVWAAVCFFQGAIKQLARVTRRRSQ